MKKLIVFVSIFLVVFSFQTGIFSSENDSILNEKNKKEELSLLFRKKSNSSMLRIAILKRMNDSFGSVQFDFFGGVKNYFLYRFAQEHIYPSITGETLNTVGYTLKKECWPNVLIFQSGEFRCKSVQKKNKWALEISTNVEKEGKTSLVQALCQKVNSCGSRRSQDTISLVEEDVKFKYIEKKKTKKLCIMLKFASLDQFSSLLAGCCPGKKLYSTIDKENIQTILPIFELAKPQGKTYSPLMVVK